MNLNNIFDSHAHYDDKKFNCDRSALLDNLFKNGICNIINVGADIKSSQNSTKLADHYEKSFCAVGVHPHEAENVQADYISVIEKLSENKKCVAIGEIGLDYYYDFSPRDVQKRVFENQLELAKKLDKPVIIHSRDACQDTMDILNRYNPQGVVHCFGYSEETAKQIINLGLYIGITGVITFKNAKKIIDVVKTIPIEKLLIETDCPYMAPEPFRGKRCDSSMLSSTAAKIAEIKGLDAQSVIDITRENTKKCFNIL